MSETGILYPPLPPPQSRSQHFQKNCAECTHSHRRCIFVSVNHPKCTRSTKMHLLCCFVPSRESIYFHVTVLLSIFLTFYLFFSTWLDQGCRNDIILKKSHEQAPLILLEVVYDLMIASWLQGSANVFTTPPPFTVVGWGGLAAALSLSFPRIFQICDHFPLMMLLPPHKPGSTYIPIRQRTVPNALSAQPLPTYLMVFPVPFVAVESAVQRKSYTNSNANFAKLVRH